jgi:4-amino-4-deoxy-L-arabinose transferase-like glycosyltransferase
MSAPDGVPTGTPAANRRARRIVVTAIACGLLLRLAFAFGYWVGKPLTLDEIEYVQLARNLAAGHGFTYGASTADGTSPQFGRAPLYPAFLAGVLRVSGAPPGAGNGAGQAELAAIKAVQAVIGAVVIWLIAVLARRAAGPSAMAAAATIAAFYPPLVWISAYVLSEPLFMAFALGSAVALGRVIDADPPAAETRRRTDAAVTFAAGVLAGLATLTRPVMLFFLLVAAAWCLLRGRRRTLIVFMAGALLVVLPWTARNIRTTGRFVLVASEGGVTFWTGNNAFSRGEGDLAANPAIKRAEIDLRRRYPGWTADQLESVYYREAFGYIRSHPGAWVLLVARKFFYLWVPVGPSYRLHSARYFAASVASYLLLLPFALAGLPRLRRAASRPRALGLLAVAAIVASLVFFPQERFRIPVLDPVLLVCAAAWFGSLAGVSRLFAQSPDLQGLV